MAVLLLQAQTPAAAAQPALENEYVRVMRDAAPCASAATAGCADRVIVALGDVELRSAGSRRRLTRGEIAVFTAGQSYEPPSGGAYLEVAFKPTRPRVPPLPVIIPPEKNTTVHDGAAFFVFEERLAVGETRARHSHNMRVVIQLNETRLQQWPDGEPEVVREIVPDRAGFNPPVVHTVKNVGERPLRGIVIEFKGDRGGASLER